MILSSVLDTCIIFSSVSDKLGVVWFGHELSHMANSSDADLRRELQDLCSLVAELQDKLRIAEVERDRFQDSQALWLANDADPTQSPNGLQTW